MTIIKAIFDGTKPSSVNVTLCDGRLVTLSGNFEIEVENEDIFLTSADQVENYNLALSKYVATYTTKSEEQKKREQIAVLKQYLNETDYIYNSIREGGRTEEYYADIIAQRKIKRKQIQDLEK